MMRPGCASNQFVPLCHTHFIVILWQIDVSGNLSVSLLLHDMMRFGALCGPSKTILSLVANEK